MDRAALTVFLALLGCASAQDLDLPTRASAAHPGSAILPVIDGLPVREREEVVWDEVGRGNIPEFLRRFVPITLTRNDALGRSHSITYEVAPDYLALGSDQDFFRMPMTPALGQQIADMLNCSLPTRRIVDDIWQAAPVQLNPVTFHPSTYDILSAQVFWQQHLGIEAQRAGRPLGLLVAGIKKDVVVTARLATVLNRVAIYGWHWPTGAPIQPLSTVHVDWYADYSHGIRLVHNRVVVDGRVTTVAAVLADPVLHPLLSDEGRITTSRYPIAAPFAALPQIDAFPPGGGAALAAAWRAKFVQPTYHPFAPASPRGDGWVVDVMDPRGGTDSIRLGTPASRDQVVQADVFCEYRPALAADGYERVGIFARDRAAGAFDGTLSQNGACYALTWDSDDGRVQCLRVAGGARLDLLSQRVYRPSTGWRRLRIEARGDELEFLVDGVSLLAVTDTTHRTGEYGIGYHENFATNANIRGTRADGFFADAPDAMRLRLEAPRAGELVFDVARGVPGDLYFSPITLNRGSYPNGWFFGIDPSLQELGGLVGSGHPAFIGRFDATGRSRSALQGLPPGIPLYGVSIDVFELLPPVATSTPVAFTTN